MKDNRNGIGVTRMVLMHALLSRLRKELELTMERRQAHRPQKLKKETKRKVKMEKMERQRHPERRLRADAMSVA